MRQRHFVLIGWTLVAVGLGLVGCQTKIIDHLPPPFQSIVFVVNGGSETIGLYWPDSGRYEPDVLTTGNTPNFLLEHRFLYLVNSGFQGTPSIQVIDPQTMEIIQTWSLPQGSNPMEAAIEPWTNPQSLWITSWTRDRVYKLDLATGSLVDSVQVGHSLDGILWLDHRLFVVSTNYDQQTWQGDTGTLYVLDPDSLTLLDSLTLGYNPMRIATDGEALFVIGGDAFANFGTIWKIDPDSLTVLASQALPGGPGDLVIQDSLVYVVGWSMPLTLVRTSDLTILRQVDLSGALPEGAGIMGVDVSDDGLQVYLAAANWTGPNALMIYDVVADSLVAVVPTGDNVGTQIVRYVTVPQ